MWRLRRASVVRRRSPPALRRVSLTGVFMEKSSMLTAFGGAFLKASSSRMYMGKVVLHRRDKRREAGERQPAIQSAATKQRGEGQRNAASALTG